MSDYRGWGDPFTSTTADVDDTWIDIAASKDPVTPDAVNVMVSVSRGCIQLAPDGAIKHISYPG